MMRVETVGLGVPRALMEARENAEGAEEGCSTTSSSSIGRDSDVSSERSIDENGENEAESAFNCPLHAMETLEQVLPIRRGISKFYNGKSKSFTTLANAASSPSVKDIAKPENAYSRRRRNLMVFSHVWDNKSKTSSLLRSNSGGISKRTMSASKSSLALAVALNNSDSSNSMTSEDSSSSSSCLSPRPPLHPCNRVSPSSPLQRSFSEWRSYSLVDLQNCAIAATMKPSNASSLGDETAHPS